jgi:hypothetical protein
MPIAEPQHADVRNSPATELTGGIAVPSPRAEEIAQLEATIGSSPRTESLGHMAAMMNASPAMVALRETRDMLADGPRQTAARSLAAEVNNSPAVTAQRQTPERSFGVAQPTKVEARLPRHAANATWIVQRNGHPLEDDENETNVELMSTLRQLDPKGTLRNLILEDTQAAKTAMGIYKKKQGKTGEADAMLFKSILATIELHKSGAIASLLKLAKPRELTEEEEKLLAVMKTPYDNKKGLVKEYGLSPVEVHAIEAYSLPNKMDPTSKHYMGAAKHWDPFKDGWEALDSALAKLPSLGKLGLEVTTYRATREQKESTALSQLPVETNIKHGVNKMNMGQQHYTSTALTYNVHSGRAEEVGGMMAITGKSGVLINPFGEQGMLDGGEILYPPNLTTRYEGQKPEGYKGTKQNVPVFHMKEVLKPESHQGVVEDENFKVMSGKHQHLDQTKFNIIGAIQKIVQQNGDEVLESARAASKIDGPIMYLTFDELTKLKKELDNQVFDKKFLHMK